MDTREIKNNLKTLNEQETYTFILLSLFALQKDPKYSTLSQLIYLLDKETMLKLCEFFGGLTIKIPTIAELEAITYALLLYKKVNIEHKDLYLELLNIIDKTENIDLIKDMYLSINDIMKEFCDD